MTPTGSLAGRVAVITGAGRGIGREHARYFAKHGARVVVNDVSDDAAQEVADELVATGAEARANADDVANWAGGEQLIRSAIEAFGTIDVLVNNAGMLRDRMLVSMSEEEWDEAIRVNLKGHFCPTRFAADHWRAQAKQGRAVNASVINTTSGSGLLGNAGQTNYGAAKAGVAAFTIICAAELERYGVRVNAIAPAARTRLTEATPGLAEVIAAPAEAGAPDPWHPRHIAPLVGYLATADCPFTGRVFRVLGGEIHEFHGWHKSERVVETKDDWSVEQLRAQMPEVFGLTAPEKDY